MYFTECRACVTVALLLEKTVLDIHIFESTRAAIAFASPAIFLICAAVASWRAAKFGTAIGVGIASLSLAISFGLNPLHGTILNSDVTSGIVSLLVSFIAWVITRYSETYMGGEPSQAAYIRWLMGTLTSVSIVLISNHLIVLAAAWLATSLCLHKLLTFYPSRPAAMIAAHKKFLASRLGDVCLIAGVLLIGKTFGTFQLDAINASIVSLEIISTELTVGVLLVVAACLIKCAQLPMHGWLLQVMEAPTPVSALLHAGVVNLGGYLLIRLAPLVSEVSTAQTLLVVVGSLTAAIAAVVMMTRISVKVMLAWSTCAQMGFMLMQCGLGAYELALLHLIGHSLYKAHAFLSAGTAVDQAKLKAMVGSEPRSGIVHAVVAALIGLGMVFISGIIWKVDYSTFNAYWVLSLVLALALSPLLPLQPRNLGSSWTLRITAAAFATSFVYFGLHFFIVRALGIQSIPNTNPFDLMFVSAVFISVFAIQTLIRTNPRAPFSRFLYPYFYSGLHLDEWFTRVTFWIWPARYPSQTKQSQGASE